MRIQPFDSILLWTMKSIKARDKRKTSLDHFSAGRVKTILIVSTTAIGDTLMSTPGIRAVRKRYPRARIIAHLNAKNYELFENNPHIDAIIPIQRGYLGLLIAVWKTRKYRPDLGIIFHGNDPQAVPAVYLSGARFIVQNHPSKKYGFLLSDYNRRLDDPPHRHAIGQRLQAAALVGCGEKDLRMELAVEKEAVWSIKRFLDGLGLPVGGILIGFQIGARDNYKVWPKDKFVELGKRLNQYNPDVRILLIGSKDEAKTCRRTAERIGPAASNTAGRINLKELKALAAQMDLLVTNDTGAMHMAIALGVRTVSLFGPTDFLGVGPAQDPHLHHVVSIEKPCRPCLTRKCMNPFCMDQIRVDRVFQVVREVLDEDRPV